MSDSADQHLATIDALLATQPGTPDLLLPTLIEIERSLGYVPDHAIARLARHFNISRADVHGVATFYADLHARPRGRRVIRICQAEACQSLGSRALTAHAVRRLGIAVGATSTDGGDTLEAAYCFGNCACGPTIQIDAQVHGRVTTARFDELVVRTEPQ